MYAACHLSSALATRPRASGVTNSVMESFDAGLCTRGLEDKMSDRSGCACRARVAAWPPHRDAAGLEALLIYGQQRVVERAHDAALIGILTLWEPRRVLRRVCSGIRELQVPIVTWAACAVDEEVELMVAEESVDARA